MSYQSWHEKHSLKHKKIVEKLSHLSDEEVIEYFDFDNMKNKEKDFCVLYEKDKKCHNMKKLNCYFCACPNFRVDKTKSFCDINSKDGGQIIAKDFIHQDCSKCIVPHTVSYVKENFDRDWNKVMNKTFINN